MHAVYQLDQAKIAINLSSLLSTSQAQNLGKQGGTDGVFGEVGDPTLDNKVLQKVARYLYFFGNKNIQCSYAQIVLRVFREGFIID